MVSHLAGVARGVREAEVCGRGRGPGVLGQQMVGGQTDGGSFSHRLLHRRQTCSQENMKT